MVRFVAFSSPPPLPRDGPPTESSAETASVPVESQVPSTSDDDIVVSASHSDVTLEVPDAQVQTAEADVDNPSQDRFLYFSRYGTAFDSVIFQ